ncbi:MAG: 50S ribosomal protein L18a [Thermoplasmata archaeon]|nr:50S ribosomal protein L18a [Thermoplasmata archaeon]
MAGAESLFMKQWTVTGEFYARRNNWQPFTKHCEAPDAPHAREWAMSEIGGCHGVKRRGIRIAGVVEVPG